MAVALIPVPIERSRARDGVPTVVQYMRASGAKPTTLKWVLSDGTACPRSGSHFQAAAMSPRAGLSGPIPKYDRARLMRKRRDGFRARHGLTDPHRVPSRRCHGLHRCRGPAFRHRARSQR
jgi:hypothetical protein